jgi:endonuclease/exonuclease/phosphatase family metal-dependent hydrolase
MRVFPPWLPALILAALFGALPVELSADEGLAVLTLNAWHGLAGELEGLSLPGEPKERREERLAWQVEELRRLAPDVLLLQEMNPAARQARRYARELGYEEIHRVVNCGVRLGPIGVPRNLHEGLAILARPGLGLRKVAAVRLSGNGRCGSLGGLQTTESRGALVGEIRWRGRRVLLVTTHLSHPPSVSPGFAAALGALLDRGALDGQQLGEILGTLEGRRGRNRQEALRLARFVEALRRERGGKEELPVILGGDLNADPRSPTLETFERAGLFAVEGTVPLPTWDPLRNGTNQSLGALSTPPLPTFGLPEVAALLDARLETPRQIDHLLLTSELEAVRVELVLDQEDEGILPSDHFGLLARVGWRADVVGPPE